MGVPESDVLPRIVVMGVTGCGKTTVGKALAERLGIPFADGDAFHSEANVKKMAEGVPLDDADREPWLRSVGKWLEEHPAGGVMGCSALKRRYRDLLREGAPEAWFVHLHGSPEEIHRRVSRRKGHFMPESLVESQFATLEPLEPDERGVVVDLELSVEEQVKAAVRAIQS
ncbi:gluconokinase [Actinocorallia longicatena]|uniref:Gluconokinase n=1 Tax=Actinocorallia longicatena TaxID=111803 RepID=A0ABP6Q7W4_9ACTN